MMELLLDAITMIVPSLLSIILFLIGMGVSKSKDKQGGWWTAGLVVYALYAFGNMASEHRNYAAVIFGAIVVTVFYFIMVKKPKT